MRLGPRVGSLQSRYKTKHQLFGFKLGIYYSVMDGCRDFKSIAVTDKYLQERRFVLIAPISNTCNLGSPFALSKSCANTRLKIPFWGDVHAFQASGKPTWKYCATWMTKCSHLDKPSSHLTKQEIHKMNTQESSYTLQPSKLPTTSAPSNPHQQPTSTHVHTCMSVCE